MPKVYNKRHGNAPAEAVYVGRPTKWGNPFIIGKDGTRQEVIELYRDLVQRNAPSFPAPNINTIRAELKGKDLVCWCAPQSCHADVLLEIANS